MSVNIEELRALAAAATPGPLTPEYESGTVALPSGRQLLAVMRVRPSTLDPDGRRASDPRHDDLSYVVAAWDAVPALCDEVERLRTEVARLRSAVSAALPYVRDAAESQPMYGGFHGGDPREFEPDPDASTDAERAAHKAACDAWDRGENPECPPTMRFGDDAAIAITSGTADTAAVDGAGNLLWAHSYTFGLGTYEIRDEAAEAALNALTDALAERP